MSRPLRLIVWTALILMLSIWIVAQIRSANAAPTNQRPVTESVSATGASAEFMVMVTIIRCLKVEIEHACALDSRCCQFIEPASGISSPVLQPQPLEVPSLSEWTPGSEEEKIYE